MNLIQVLAAPILSVTVKASLATCDGCGRSLPIKNPNDKKAGITMRGRWYCCSNCFTRAVESELSSIMSSRHYRQDAQPRMPLALSMVSRGLLTEEQYRHAAKVRKETGREIGDILISYGVITEAQFTAARAALWGCPVFDVPDFPMPFFTHIPQTLLNAHGAVPLHYVQGARILLVGFLQAVEYGFLYAVESVADCKTQACFITPSDFNKRVMQHQMARESSATAPPMEIQIDHARNICDIARALCKKSVEFEADEAIIAQCKGFVWSRLKCSGKETDLIFHT